MPTPKSLTKATPWAGLLARAVVLGLLADSASVQAQSVCSSDGQPRPVALLERWMDADCQSCWTDRATPAARPGDAILDWVLPSAKGEEAALSAVARQDGLQRLQALGRPPATEPFDQRTAVQPVAGSLRVAHGLAFNGYVGTSIGFTPRTPKTANKAADGGPWRSWLVLVEVLPAGTEGSPVARQLVRNLLQTDWPAHAPAAALREARSMHLPEGSDPQRLRLIGWVENSHGRVVAAAQSRCTPTPTPPAGPAQSTPPQAR